MKVIWTKEAIESFKETIDFYRFSLNEQVANKRRLLVLSKVQGLINFPEVGQIEENEVVKDLNCRYLVADFCKIIYRLNDNQVEILKVFDTRQRPDKMKLEEQN